MTPSLVACCPHCGDIATHTTRAPGLGRARNRRNPMTSPRHRSQPANPRLAALIAERNAGAWWARRVNEHRERQALAGQARADAAAAEVERYETRARERWAQERLAVLVVAAESGDSLEEAAAGLWLTPEGLRSWLAIHDRDLLDQLRTNRHRVL